MEDDLREELHRERRTPHGVRGLKSPIRGIFLCHDLSHPAWGAWIEMWMSRKGEQSAQSRTPHGVRGLKFTRILNSFDAEVGRTPHGVRGLKCDDT